MTGPRKRSITIAGHRTSVSLEEPFWEALAQMAAEQGTTLAGLVARIDRSRGGAASQGGLSGAIRIHLLLHYRRRAAGREAG